MSQVSNLEPRGQNRSLRILDRASHTLSSYWAFQMMRKKLIFFLTIFFGESINAAKKKRYRKKAQNDFVGGCTFLVAALESFLSK